MACRVKALVLGLAGGLFAAAAADPVAPSTVRKYVTGQYLAAADAAVAAAAPSADALAFASRAVLAHCLTGEEPPPVDLLERAIGDAEQAIGVDPDHEEARLQLAIALSLKSRSMGLAEALRSGVGERTRRLAEEVLEDNPENAYAHAFLAAWNVEVRRRSGPVGARFLGASLDDAREHYAEAARLAPNDAGIHWQYGRALVALDAKRHGEEAAAAFELARAAIVSEHVQEVMKARAGELAALLAEDPQVARIRALAML